MRITKVYTKTGDDGTTGLARGERVPKDHPRIQVLGSLDETNSAIGLVLTLIIDDRIKVILNKVQHVLFDIGGDLAMGGQPLGLVKEEYVIDLESAIDELNSDLPPLKEFILPGGSKASAHLHHARSVSRRTERDLISLHQREPVDEIFIKYLNRLSDFLFVAARVQNAKDGGGEEIWEK
jgi:cob(I)alamin adenosyltransferase|tara:strand:+ start:4928 stop:5467 length:540 start_codon:yes stop_codon:yes gene_type:complete